MIIASTYTFDNNPERVATSIEADDINGDNVIALNSNDQIIISADDDYTPNGETVLLTTSSDELYLGNNFVLSQGENTITLTGQVSNVNSDSKSLVVTIQMSQFGSRNSTYVLNGEQISLTGTLGTQTYNQILDINANYPQVKTIVLKTIEGQ